MSTIGHFLYFLNLSKETLSFRDGEDFAIKIKNNFNFRIKVQKFVYIAKYFGWNHSYQYSLYARGPYSSALADEYYNNSLLEHTPLKINDFDSGSFNEFVKEKTIYYLESVATILYFLNCEKNFPFTDAITKLNIIKPHIDSEIVENAYNDIMEWNLIKKDNVYGIVIIDDDLDSRKEILNKKIDNYIDYFKDFGRCNNSIVVAGSLDYLKKVLIHETLDLEMKNDLLKLISRYVEDVEKIYELCGGNTYVFGYMNLDSLENNFDRIQDYISQELDIYPRLDDEEYENIIGD